MIARERKFRVIVIQASCNLTCDYCGGSAVKIDVHKTIENLEKIFSRFNPEESCFRAECFGEISLYPDIIAFLENKARQGYLIEVLSNGIKAPEVIGNNTLLRWIFSLDGHTVEMNRHRNLSDFQIQIILQAILQYNAEIQCVYFDQTVAEMNSFIAWLQDKNYKGFLHIFPVRLKDRPILNIFPIRRKDNQIKNYLDYDKLLKTNFIPDAEYFRRWKHIYEKGRREFSCDFLENGYVYVIRPDRITMVKCDCSNRWGTFEHQFENERIYKIYPCETCLTHFEYNNHRAILNQNGGL